ncbi:putative D-/L-hydantoinase subunit A [Paramyrothecium foliicola]|nr:putative D-/L-hydantoinase subunit A [Paramyrothecium foliicola]
MSLFRIGVDVGGTNTDAAILDIKAFDTPGRGVLASHKASTTEDITSGIEASIRAVLNQSAVDQNRVLSVTIGTTHFINALVEADARRLDRVAVVRLCGPFTRQIPPFSDFPVGLRGILDGGVTYLDGGFEIDGREIAPLNMEQIRTAARDIAAAGIRAVALVGVFSPLDHEGLHEEQCKRIMLEEVPELRVVCSHDIGPTGFLERENATILNAAILRTATKVTKGFRRAMARLQLSCPLYLSQNDGTLIEADVAVEYPIKTFASGPTNSMTGAAFLAGIDQTLKQDDDVANRPQILVVDIGGTTTDVCALLPSGFPRQAPGFVEVGGVRTAFSMPEVVSIGLGGGSKVQVDEETNGNITIGPGSVGHFLTREARVFGGKTLTSSDIVVAAGKTQLGDAELVRDIPDSVVQGARKEMKRMLEGVVEQMKVSAAPVHMLLCGGGALLVTEDLDNVDKCIHPIHQGAANAVGAAIAKVSGDIDVVEVLAGRSEADIIEAARKKAIDLAVLKGAARRDVEIVEINKMPLQYTDNAAMRIQVRAVGKLAIPTDLSTPPPSPPLETEKDSPLEDEGEKVSIANGLQSTVRPSLAVDLTQYRPEVRQGVWYVSEVDLELISTGCGVLGTGGGGPTHHEYLKSLHSLRTSDQGRMRIISPKALKDTDMICFGSWYGSPSVINERIAGGNEIAAGIEAVGKIVGCAKFDGIFIDEIGGGNGMSVFPTGVHFDIPVIDGDAMGRAYPTMYHATFSVYGHSLTPCVLSDARNNISVVMVSLLRFKFRKGQQLIPIELGLGCAVCANPLSGAAVKSHGVPNTVSLAWYLGRAIHEARRLKQSYLDAIVLISFTKFDVCAGKLLYTGKIVDVRRYIGGGYTMGTVIIGPSNDERDEAASPPREESHMTIPFQNEYLYAALGDADGSEKSQKVVCTVPDLISILGQDGEAIGSQDLRYGLRVSVIALPAHPLWKTEKGLAVGGPEGFGLKLPVVGVDNEFVQSRSVIEEFDSQIRHKKCDEGKPTCLRCKNDRVVCDGYAEAKASPEPKKSKKCKPAPNTAFVDATSPPTHSVILRPPPNPCPDDSPLEIQFFSHFCFVTSLELDESPELTDFWTLVALPLAHQDVAIRRTMAAVGAAHQLYMARGVANTPSHVVIDLYFEGFNLYNQAIAHLTGSTLLSTETLLLCCLLFISYESMVGRYKEALRHLKAGLRLLADQNITISSTASNVMKAICHIFGEVGTDYSILMDDWLSPPSEVQRKICSANLQSQRGVPFKSLSLAATELRHLDLMAMELEPTWEQRPYCAWPTEESLAVNAKFREWSEHFDLTVSSMNRESLSAREAAELTSLRLQQGVWKIALHFDEPKKDQSTIDESCENFWGYAEPAARKLIALQRPTFAKSGSLVSGLSLIIFMTSDRNLQLQACALLEVLNRREGGWDSRDMAEMHRGMLADADYAKWRDIEAALPECVQMLSLNSDAISPDNGLLQLAYRL